MDNVTLIRVVAGILAVVVFVILLFRMKKKAPRLTQSRSRGVRVAVTAFRKQIEEEFHAKEADTNTTRWTLHRGSRSEFRMCPDGIVASSASVSGRLSVPPVRVCQETPSAFARFSRVHTSPSEILFLLNQSAGDVCVVAQQVRTRLAPRCRPLLW